MTQPDTLQIANAIAEVARPLIRESYTADSCIASTWVAVESLKYFGITAAAHPVTVLAFSPDAWKILDDGGTMNDVASAVQSSADPAPGGPWSVGVGLGGDDRVDRWRGHLVAAIRADGIAIDLSIDQASRPLKDMHFGPTVFSGIEPEWWDDANAAPLLEVDQGALVYRSDPGNDTYTVSTDWSGPSGPRRKIVGQVIRAVREALDG